ncbi:cytochrome P450 monooxygenase [Mycolicibacterium arabiense]|uniref:Cytochrome P450 monooxygenase n=1 Tax=Mycolicibacterium arabiense TaxID=1286181 RepID=A0A7I7RZA6_9MYCO|nr:cytochrome P450 [Mycolicibacterium arabiense]BBY49984.1 cytochrome P450 monooxygenase [Mycolicibacterium arabiense]
MTDDHRDMQATHCPHSSSAPAEVSAAPRLVSTRPVPVYDEDLYSPAAIADPHPHYAAMRALGPVVWLSKHRMYAAPRFESARAALADDETFRSGDAVAITRLAQLTGRKTTIVCDGEAHLARRKLVTSRLTPRALRSLKPDVEAMAVEIVDGAVRKGRIDAVADMALAMPLTVVPDMMGWPQHARGHLLPWGVAAFDYAGPANRLFLRSLPGVIAMRLFVARLVRTREVMPGGIAAELLEAVDSGALTKSQCALLLIDVLAPSIDTTASIIAAAVQLFADHPEQFEELRRDRRLMPNAVNEVVRHASPLRAFTRRVHHATELATHTIPGGSQLLVLFASANRDETVFPEPDEFDIHRDTTGQLGFGYGTHTCGGQGLARMETAAILSALLDRVERIRRIGTGRRAINNVIYRWESLPVELTPRRSAATESREQEC